MKLLIIEDEEEIIDGIRDALRMADLPIEIHLESARSKASAYDRLAAGTYDLILCDRRLPTTDGSLDAADEHGDAVFDRIGDQMPGTPAIVLTGYGSVTRASELLRRARAADLFGKGINQPMADHYEKGDLDKCLARIIEVAREIAILEDIEIAPQGFSPDRPLRRTERRLLQIFARSIGPIARVKPLGGGWSEALTCLVTVEDAFGRVRSRSVAKLGRLQLIRKEETAYQTHVATALNVGTFTALVKKIDVGAGDVAGLFYTLADGYSQSLFEVVVSDPPAAARVLQELRGSFTPWVEASRRQTLFVRDIRRMLVSDTVMTEICAPQLIGIPWEAFERRQVSVNVCPQHADLHAHNVLVAENRPVLIDYAEAREATAALDAITLELSLLFHPTNVLGQSAWPTEENLSNWMDPHAFSHSSPYREYLIKCREIADAAGAGPREVCATAYSYAVRQLKYDDTDKTHVLQIVRSAIRCFD